MGCYWLIRPNFLAISTNPYDMLWVVNSVLEIISVCPLAQDQI